MIEIYYCKQCKTTHNIHTPIGISHKIYKSNNPKNISKISITFNYKELISIDSVLSDKIISILKYNKEYNIKDKKYLNHYKTLKLRIETYLKIMEK